MAVKISQIDPDTLYLVIDAAKMLDVGEQTVRSYLNDQSLKGVKNKKGRWRIHGKELIKFIQGGKAAG